MVLSNHSALRKCYFVRNLLYFRKEYLPFFKNDLKAKVNMEIRVVMKILFFEKDKLNKFKMM